MISPGTVVKTNYSTGPFLICSASGPCTCPSYLDQINERHPPASAPHFHYQCRSIRELGPRGSDSYLNGYDEQNRSVWSDDRLFVVSDGQNDWVLNAELERWNAARAKARKK